MDICGKSKRNRRILVAMNRRFKNKIEKGTKLL